MLKMPLNYDPTRSLAFVKDGVARGGHWPNGLKGRRANYVVSVNLYGRLPFLLVEPRLHPGARERHGIKQPLGGGFDKKYRAFSTGLGMPGRIFGVELARQAFEATKSLLFLEVAPSTDERSALTVTCRSAYEAIDLAWALLDVLDGLVASGATFPDALGQHLGVRENETLSPDILERIVDKLTGATHWLSGHVARVGNAVEARLTLLEVGDEQRGTLRLAWDVGDVEVAELSLDAALPPDGDGSLELWAETTSLLSMVRARLEPRIGDASLDDALHVRGDTARGRHLTNAKDIVLRLCVHDARMVIDGARVLVRVPAARRSLDETYAIVDDLLRLWRRLSLARSGITTE